MISLKQWIALLLFYLFYLLGGALIFLYLESEVEINSLKEIHNLQKRLSVNLYFIENEPVKEEIHLIIQELESSVGKKILLPTTFQEELLLHIIPINELPTERILNGTNSTELLQEIVPQFNQESSNLTQRRDELLSPHPLDLAVINGNVKWTVWNSFFFSFTAITTIGFGHMSPNTEAGQGFCIVYSLFGVPLNGIVFAGLADLFASKIIMRLDAGHYKKRRSMVFGSCLYLLPGLCILILLPAALFMVAEGWSFLASIYFSFITLTTIGFGDYVAGQESNTSVAWMWPYRICIMIWIIFGLGYLLMVIAFIQRALRSKEVRLLDRKMKHTFKEKMGVMQSNISRDIHRMRSVLDGIAKLKKTGQIASDGSICNDAYEDDEFDNSEDSNEHSNVEEKNRKKDINVDMFLHLAESILKQSETDLEDRVNEYNRTLTSLNELSLDDEYDNTFRASLFPARDSIAHNKPPSTRRPSIWTSTTPSSLFVPSTENNIPEVEKGTNDLSQLIERFHEMVESEDKHRRNNRLKRIEIDTKRRHSTAIPSDSNEKKEPHRIPISAAKRRQTVAELHIENESVRL